MVRRKLTLKRVDPWSVLKFGFVLNIALLVVALIGFWVIWTVIGRLGLVDSFCDSVGEVFLDLEDCGLNFGPLFRTVLLLGGLGVIAQTGIMVFGAFLYNLIADLTGGLQFSFLDEQGEGTVTTARRAESATGPATGSAAGPAGGASASAPTSGRPPSSGPMPQATPPDTTRASSPAPRSSVTSASSGPSTPPGGPEGGASRSAPSTPQSPGSPQPPRSSRPSDDTQRQASRQSLWGDKS